MKATIIATMITVLAAPVFAGATENITGCATQAVQGTNYTVKIDPNCALAVNKDGDNSLMMLAASAWLEAIAPEEPARH